MRRYLVVYLYSFTLSLVCVLAPHGLDKGIKYCFLVAFFFSIPLMFLISFVLTLLGRMPAISPDNSTKGKMGCRIFSAAFCLLAICWLIAWGACYPGICGVDTEDTFKMIWGGVFKSDHFRYDTLNNHHPVFYTAVISLPMNLFRLIGFSESASVALVSLLHLIFLAFCCSFFLSKAWRLTQSKAFVVGSLVFFLFNPLMMLYSVAIWKDIPFGGAFLVMLIELLMLLELQGDFFRSRSDTIALALSVFFCAMLRSNGIYVVVPLAALLCLFLKQTRKQVLLLFGSVILVVVMVLGPLLCFFRVAPAHFSESVGVPLQQMALVAISPDGNLSEEQREYLDGLLPYEEYVERYNPLTPNPLKFSPNFDDDFLEKDKITFFKEYLQIGLQNPKLYIEAWIDQTIYFWSPGVDMLSFGVVEPGYELEEGGLVHRNIWNGAISFDDIQILLEQATVIFRPIYNMGVLAWTALFVVLALLLGNRKELLLCMVPILLLWATLLIAAPQHDFRYFFPVQLALPFMVLVLASSRSSKSCSE